MKKMILVLSAATVFAAVSGCTTYYAGPPPSHPYETRAPAPPFVTVSQPSYLILIPSLSVYFVPNASAEIFFYGGRWYYRLGTRWYWGTSYRGPWTYAELRVIPRPLRQLPRDYRARYRSRYYRVPYGHWKKRRQEPPPKVRYRHPTHMYRVPNLNVYIIPGISADIVFYNGGWYNRYKGVWYMGPHYSGPWAYLEESKVPRKLWELGPDYRKDMKRYERVPYGAWKRPGNTEQKPRAEWKRPRGGMKPPAVRHKPDENGIAKKREAPTTLPELNLQRPARVHYMKHRKIYYVPGISRDIVYFKGGWYMRRHEAWYLGGSFKGPWNLIRGRKIPGAIKALPDDFRDESFEDIPYGHWNGGKKTKGKRKYDDGR
ncbi:MAG: hypothetical protein GXP52_04025 [Deltaproteobacteria bacterium]|nr:hypothetical protein [Deltaproteobacteria bacterium]